MLALSCLDKLIELDPHTSWVSFLSSRGYLKHLIDSLLDSERKLLSVLETVPATLRPLYLYESKMVSRAKTMGSMKTGTFRHEWVNLLTCLTILLFFHFSFFFFPFCSFFSLFSFLCVCFLYFLYFFLPSWNCSLFNSLFQLLMHSSLVQRVLKHFWHKQVPTQ